MTAPWPCSTCGAPGARNLGTQGYCAQHLTAFYRRLPSHVWDGIGWGLPTGPIADTGSADLECSLCAATWIGPAFMSCPWCLRAVADMRRWQAELVLTPPDTLPHDIRYRDAMTTWADRLVNAVKADLITREQAERTWQRAVGHVAA